MQWIAISERLPAGPALIYADGECHVAEIVGDSAGSSLAFIDLHSSDLLPWPSHWMPCPQAPALARTFGLRMHRG